jgi:hypothetical protein
MHMKKKKEKKLKKEKRPGVLFLCPMPISPGNAPRFRSIPFELSK